MKRTILKYRFKSSKKIHLNKALVQINEKLLLSLEERKVPLTKFLSSVYLKVSTNTITIISPHYVQPLGELLFYGTPTNELYIDNKLAVEEYPKMFYKQELIHLNKIETNELFQRLSLSNIMFDEFYKLFPEDKYHFILRCNPFGNTSETVISQLYLNKGFKYYPKIFTGHDSNLMFKE
jgi:hypothetical protein